MRRRGWVVCMSALPTLALFPLLAAGCGNGPYAGGCPENHVPYTEIEGEQSELDVALFEGSGARIDSPEDCRNGEREAWRVHLETGLLLDVATGQHGTAASDEFFASVSDELSLDRLAFRGGVPGCAEGPAVLTDDWSKVETIAQVVIDHAAQDAVSAALTIVVTGVPSGCPD